MAEPSTIKKKLLQELSGGVNFLRNVSSKGNKSTGKSPRRRWTRSSGRSSGSRKSIFPFRFSKDPVELDLVTGSKSDSLKENAKRSKSVSAKDRLEKNNSQKEVSTRVVEEKHTPLKEKSVKNAAGSNTSKNKQEINSTKPVPTTQFPHKWQDNDERGNSTKKLLDCDAIKEISTLEKNTLKNETKKSKTTGKSINLDSSITKERHKPSASTAEKSLLSINKGSRTDQITVKKTTNHRISRSPTPVTKKNHPQLQRSLSDPISFPGVETPLKILPHNIYQTQKATITQADSTKKPRHNSADTYTLDDEVAKDLLDIEVWKEEIKKSVFLSQNSSDESYGRMFSSKLKSTCIENYYPLLRTKIPEEDERSDESTNLKNKELAKTDDPNRDSGVNMDSNLESIPSSHDSTDNECELHDKDGSLPSDDIFESNNDTDGSDYDTLKNTKKDKGTSDIETGEIDDTTLRRNSEKSKDSDEKWDMYALLKKFEYVEWDLSPASSLSKQTLDLDNCDLDEVPQAVVEIEYFAFRDVEAVSLNYNEKIENADILGKLTDLRIINMCGCNLKAVPQSWSRLTKLQMLGLGNNTGLKVFGPLKHLTNLVWLDLGGCGLTRLPDAVTNMMKLRVLALGGNRGIEIGDEICSLWDLKQLGLNDCGLECIPKAVFSLTKLTHLHLDNNYICQISQEILHLSELEELTVTGNGNIQFPKILSQCDSIKCIVVDQSKDLTRCSGTLKSRMKQMPTALTV